MENSDNKYGFDPTILKALIERGRGWWGAFRMRVFTVCAPEATVQANPRFARCSSPEKESGCSR